MWLFSQGGMFSIVEDEDNDHLLVRARVAGDIERYWPNATVAVTDVSDYRYRATLPRRQVADVIHAMVENIEYGNFKDSVRERQRIPFYLRVWEAMIDMQETFAQDEEETEAR